MKIAIASEGSTIEDSVSNVCGRASNFLIFEDKKLIEVVSNPFKGGGGAGTSVVQMLADKDVEMIICGKFGGNALMWAESKNIKHKEILGKLIKDVLLEL